MKYTSVSCDQNYNTDDADGEFDVTVPGLTTTRSSMLTQ